MYCLTACRLDHFTKTAFFEIWSAWMPIVCHFTYKSTLVNAFCSKYPITACAGEWPVLSSSLCTREVTSGKTQVLTLFYGSYFIGLYFLIPAEHLPLITI